ncbi:MAG: Mu transposase C-terminal domain-containing protein [Gammaproteobacteria bacterium]
MLRRNDLIEYSEPAGKRIRVLWLDMSGDRAAVIDVEARDAMPAIVELSPLLQDLETRRATLLLNDAYLVVVPEEAALPQRHRDVRDNAWNRIRGLVANEPDIFCANRRWDLVVKCIRTHHTTHRMIYKYLRRYWQRGQTPNALVPDYAKSGRRGMERSSGGTRKRGRPVRYGSSPGLNVTPEIRQVFQVATQRFYASGSKFTQVGAYNELIRTFFTEKTVDPETGRLVHRPVLEMEPTGFPTLGQYRYWLTKDFKPLDIKRSRVGDKIYDKDMRGLLGTSTAEALGPGNLCQIDATIADVYLVSRLDRQRIVGRPVFYAVIDVFSRMIVGLYIGLEGPSWVGAMMALASTNADKVGYCRQFGIEIIEADWPCHFLPGALLGDRGEIASSAIDSLSNNFRVDIQSAAPYRADWKGVVEQRFNLLPAQFRPYVPGYIECDFRARGGKDYRLDAVLDLDDFTRIVIESVLYHNNHHELKKYDKDRDVLADGVPAIPTELWEWGIRNWSGNPRSFPEELVRFGLLPTDTATVTAFGIRWRGVFYASAKAVAERWFDRARQSGSWKVAVSYDPRDVDTIYLHHETATMNFEVCNLIERSRAYQHLTLWEVDQQQQLEKHAGANRSRSQQLAGTDAAASIARIVEQAERKRGKPGTESAASRTRNIRGNRAKEKQANRAVETFRLGPTSPGKSAEVLPFPGSAGAKPDYSEPDITEILGSGGDEDA